MSESSIGGGSPPSAASSTSTQWPSTDGDSVDGRRERETGGRGDLDDLQSILDRATASGTDDDAVVAPARDPPTPRSAEFDVDDASSRPLYELAARRIRDADVLLAVTGAGFSADSGLATYADVANVGAYRRRGWRYADLCRPLDATSFAEFDNGLEDERSTRGDRVRVEKTRREDHGDDGGGNGGGGEDGGIGEGGRMVDCDDDVGVGCTTSTGTEPEAAGVDDVGDCILENGRNDDPMNDCVVGSRSRECNGGRRGGKAGHANRKGGGESEEDGDELPPPTTTTAATAMATATANNGEGVRLGGDNGMKMECDCLSITNDDGEGEQKVWGILADGGGRDYYGSSRTLPDEDDIDHPKYFYGFWGQCCNDYRSVGPHEGYDILARWGRDKNFAPAKRGGGHGVDDGGGGASASAGGGDDGGWASAAAAESATAREIREITLSLESGRSGGGGDDSSSPPIDDDPRVLRSAREDEPFHVSPTRRAGAFHVFTSNVDAHSYDVFESHEVREVHGNVEVWSCHNFACGTNVDERTFGSRCDVGGGDDTGRVDGANGVGRQRRLWRLPTDFRFEVDRREMSAPYSRAGGPGDGDVEARADEVAFEFPAAQSGTPASKRRKSEAPSSEEEDERSAARDDGGNSAAGFDAQDDTATALGGIMEHHLSKALSNRLEPPPAHVGGVRGKPRLRPLRYMNPPPPADGDGKGAPCPSDDANYFLPLSKGDNWPRCPRCREAARPAVLMFDDLDWICNVAQEVRWSNWCRSLLKLCKRRRVRAGGGVEDDESASTVSGDDLSEGGWRDVDPEVKSIGYDEEEKRTSKSHLGLSESQSSTAKTELRENNVNAPDLQSGSDPPQCPLKVVILEIGCGYNVPTCRVVSERLACELSQRGGDPTLVRINPLHPESDDPDTEEFLISIKEKGLVALKAIDEYYTDFVQNAEKI